VQLQRLLLPCVAEHVPSAIWIAQGTGAQFQAHNL